MDIQARIEELQRTIDHKCSEVGCYRYTAQGITLCNMHMTGGDHIYDLEERIKHDVAIVERDMLVEALKETP